MSGSGELAVTEYRGFWVKSYKTLNKALTDTISEVWKDYMLVAPNGVELGIEVGRKI